MDDKDIAAGSNHRSTARVIMGALLVAAGAALLIERLGAMPPAWRASIWPVLLIGYGLARLLQPRAQGREGLFFVLTGGWWLAGISEWISLERTWPLLFVALGVSIMFQAVTSGAAADADSQRVADGQRSAAPWLLLAILIGAAVTSGLGRQTFATNASGEGVLRVYSVLGGSTNRVRATTLIGGEVVSIMGGSTIDLRDVTIAPGDTITLNVFTLMGGGTIRVPDGWTVDLRAVPVMAGIRDRRIPRASQGAAGEPGAGEPGTATATAPAPRLILRGTVIMGGLSVRS